MRRRASLAALCALLGITAAAACSSGGGAGSAFVNGTVQDPAAVVIAGAAVSLGNANASTDATGKFSVGVSPGNLSLAVVKAGYRPLESQLHVVSGNANNVTLTLVPCTVGVDSGCPPPTSPVPVASPLVTPPTVNVVAKFSGVNSPTLNVFPAWSGSAAMMGSSTRYLGQYAGTTTGLVDKAWSECWKSSDNSTPMVSTDLPAAIDHCWIWWFGCNKGPTAPNPPDADALFLLRVAGPLWRDGQVVEALSGTTAVADYYEGVSNNCDGTDNGSGNFAYNFTVPATAAAFRLSKAGYSGAPVAQPVVLTTGYFYVPSLP